MKTFEYSPDWGVSPSDYEIDEPSEDEVDWFDREEDEEKTPSTN
jgi:hypothetical protein